MTPDGQDARQDARATRDTDRDAQRSEVAGDLRVMCMRIARRARTEQSERLPHHLYSILAQLEHEDRTPGQIARAEGVSPSFVGRCLVELADDGLVTRSDDPVDGRKRIVRLSESGRATILRTRSDRDQWMAARVAALPADDFAVLDRAVAILQRLERA